MACMPVLMLMPGVALRQRPYSRGPPGLMPILRGAHGRSAQRQVQHGSRPMALSPLA